MTTWIKKIIFLKRNRSYIDAYKQADLSRPEDRNKAIAGALDVTIKQYGRALSKLTNE